MFFNFQLDQVENLPPRSYKDGLRLNWFDLTYGGYWLQAGESQLFRHSPAVIAYVKQLEMENPDAPEEIKNTPWDPHAEYYVARLWQDIVVETLPFALDPLPEPLVNMMASPEKWRAWELSVEDWEEIHSNQEERPDLYIEEAYDLSSKAFLWWSKRVLYTSYLNAGPIIWFWSDGEQMHCMWDNRDRFIDGIPAWDTQIGHVAMPVSSFLEEVTSFHNRCLEAMEERIQSIRASWPFPDVKINLEQIEADHQRAAGWLEKSLQGKGKWARSKAEWDDIIQAIDKLNEYMALDEKS